MPFWPLVLPLHGVFVVFLFTLEHEATHRTPFASEALNEGVGRVCGFLLLLPFEWFRWFHLAHHRWTNIPGQDPELEGGQARDFGAVGGPCVGRALLAGWRAVARGAGAAADGGSCAAGRAGPGDGAGALDGGGLCAGLASLWVTPGLFWLWLLPVVLGQPVLRLYLLAAHGDCRQLVNMLQNTRTTFTVRLVRVLSRGGGKDGGLETHPTP